MKLARIELAGSLFRQLLPFLYVETGYEDHECAGRDQPHRTTWGRVMV